MNQSERVIDHIQKNGSLNRLEAFKDLGIFELASRINALELQGWRFTKTKESGVNRFGDKFTYATYRIDRTDDFKLT